MQCEPRRIADSCGRAWAWFHLHHAQRLPVGRSGLHQETTKGFPWRALSVQVWLQKDFLCLHPWVRDVCLTMFKHQERHPLLWWDLSRWSRWRGLRNQSSASVLDENSQPHASQPRSLNMQICLSSSESPSRPLRRWDPQAQLLVLLTPKCSAPAKISSGSRPAGEPQYWQPVIHETRTDTWHGGADFVCACVCWRERISRSVG